MKKSSIATLLVLVLLIPATLYLGTKLPGRSYYLTGTLIIIELMIPFFMAFEGRRPQARELVLIAVMCALAIAGRVAIPIPHFKAIYAVIMISGVAFGPQAGFMVGAIAAFGSNFFYSQGAYTPWQMISYGAAGLIFGVAFGKGRLPVRSWLMAVLSFLTVVLIVGPILDSMSIFLGFAKLNKDVFRFVFLPGLGVNITQGLCTAAMMLIFGKPLLAILNRIQRKYGIFG